MINLIKKKLFKRQVLNRLQNEIWKREISVVSEQGFLEYAREILEMLGSRVNIYQEYLDRLKDSHKYEDREKRKKAEEDLKRAQGKYQQQKKEMEIAREKIDGSEKKIGLLEQIENLKRDIEAIREKF